MEITVVKPEDGKEEEDSLQSTSKDRELEDQSGLSKRMEKMANLKGWLLLNTKHSQSGESCIQKSFLQRIHGLDNRIPKHIISLDEKYIRHCLEWIYVSASKAGSCNILDNLGYSKMGISTDGLSIRNTYACHLANFSTEILLDGRTGNEVTYPTEECIIGSLSTSKTINNILDIPLMCQSGEMESDVDFGILDLVDTKKSLGSSFWNSSRWLGANSSQKLDSKIEVLRKYSYGREPLCNRLVSVSSTNSTYSDQTSSSLAVGVIQGILQCTWKSGFPHYVFSVGDQKELYVANLLKAESPDDKFLDCMYVFHSTSVGKKEHQIGMNESDLVGKMRVSTKFLVCPNNSYTVETEFVLFGCDESSLGVVQTSSQTPKKKNKGLSKKMVDVFKPSLTSWERTFSKYVGTSVILKNSSLKLWPHTHACPSPLGTSNLLVNYIPPNLELAAIIVNDHVRGDHKGLEIGGWGLNFLKKVETNKAVASVEAGCCLRNSGDCTTSMDVLVPAGFHGGPRNRNGGPPSLTERWRSGGHCDCGGWDIGCPLTVLDTRPSIKDISSPQVNTEGDKESFDLFIKGSNQGTPVVEMVNIHEGLYFIRFQTSLSALQSFSIAMAFIHTRTPALQPKVYRS